MKQLPAGTLCYEFDRRAGPRVRIAAGERLLVETEDAFSGQIRIERVPYSNPLNGPIVVEGAVPGDTIAPCLRDLRPPAGRLSLPG